MKNCILELVVSVVFTSALLAGCVSENAESMLLSAKSYLAKNDRKAAVIQLKNVLQKSPDSPEARFLLGRTLLQSGDPVSAEVELRKALELKYPASQVVPALAKSLVTLREYKKLTDQFGDVVLSEREPAAEFTTWLAIAHAAQGNTEKYRSALRSAFESVPDYPPALIFQARLEASERQFDKAFKSIDKALSIKPADAEALQIKGDLLFHGKSDIPGAIEAYRKALSVDPAHVPAHAGIIEGFLVQRNIEAASAQVDELRKVLPNYPQTMYFEAQIAYLKKNYKEARELIQKVLRVVPSNARALQLAGAIELNSQSLVQAQDHLGKALQLSPTLTSARRLLAQSYILSGQAQKALDTLSPLLSNNNADAETLSLAAQAYMQIGDSKSARESILQSAKLDPTQTMSRVALALGHMNGNNVDATLAEIEVIAETDAELRVDLVLVNAYILKSEYDKALKTVERIEKKQPNKPATAHLRGRIQLLRKDTADARRSFERALSIDPVFVPAAVNLSLLDLADNKPDLAKKRFDKILAIDPKNTKALLAAAGLRARAGGSVEEVGALFADAVKSNPADATSRLSLIDHYLTHKDAKRALSIAQDAVAALPQSPELLDALGRAQVSAGERNQAINSFNKLTELQPASPRGFMRLAGMYAEEKDTDKARSYFKRALGITPNLLNVQRALIEIELASQHPDEAIAIARTVRKQRPSEDAGFLFEGAVEFSRKNFPAAIEVYRAGLKQAASTDMAVALNATLDAASQTSEAEKFATAWLKEHPTDSRFLWHLGTVSLTRGNYSAAEGYFRRVDQLQPGNPLVLNNLAWTMAKLGKPGAVAYAEKANSLAPDKAVILDTLAFVLASEKQLAKAIEVEKKALTLAPDGHDMRLSLAKFYIQAGDKASARAQLDMLAKLEGKFPSQAEVSRLLATL